MSKIPCFEYDDMSNTTEKVIGSFGGRILYGKYIEETVNTYTDAGGRRTFTLNIPNTFPVNALGWVVLNAPSSYTGVRHGIGYSGFNPVDVTTPSGTQNLLIGDFAGGLVQGAILYVTSVVRGITSITFKTYVMYTKD